MSPAMLGDFGRFVVLLFDVGQQLMKSRPGKREEGDARKPLC